ncbi:MAG: 2Fe-2S iron-sulfur cluster binding domain-containing protein [Novosphingobium sp.]|nr:2Fe-2S iron-sulfur cluster binding domain-containing protein [Novosphingobium sp.]
MKVVFVTADGDRKEVQARAGTNLLALGQASGMPLEGTCEGQMACSTCHVVIGKDWFSKLEAASEEEEDMLDLAAGVTAHSRLSCQIDLSDNLDGIEVHMPGLWHDMQIG